MAKMVGYACSIRLSWLNEAVRMLKEKLPEAEYKEKMNEYLSYEIDSSTRLRKTREILMNVWYYPSEELDLVRKDALEVLAEYPDCSEPIQYLIFVLHTRCSRMCARSWVNCLSSRMKLRIRH